MVTRSTSGEVLDTTDGFKPVREPLSPNMSVLYAEPSIALWQFARLNPEAMMAPKLLRRVAGYLPLATDGSNIAELLLDISQRDPAVIDGIIETIQFVLPYVQEVQPTVTSEIGRNVYLRLREQKAEMPGWLFSTGTLRLVALLALFRHPDPPPLIVIEELENGLDPRTIGLIVEEMREVVSGGTSQIVVTTHSPYLLDLLPLDCVIFVERIGGQPTFFRPGDDESIQEWNRKFAPGRLYTMGSFRKSR
jgi:predicted ATPase